MGKKAKQQVMSGQDKKDFKFLYKRPTHRREQFVRELKEGQATNTKTGEIIPLSEKQKSFRAGYMLAAKDNTQAYHYQDGGKKGLTKDQCKKVKY